MAVLTGGIWFLVVVLISISPAPIRNAEYLVLWWLEYFSFMKVWKFCFQLASCKLGVCAIYFSSIYPRIFLEASCHWQHTCLRIRGAFGQVVVTDNVHTVAALGANSVGKVGFLGWRNRVECTRANISRLMSTYSPLKHHTHTHSGFRLIPTGATAPCWLCFRA